MTKKIKILCCAALIGIIAGIGFVSIRRTDAATSNTSSPSERLVQDRRIVADYRFNVDILVNGRPLDEYWARGRSYIQAIDGEEYEVRIHNPLPQRVAVALSVDGLNSIDARRTSAWNASKWVIEPYGTIHVGGWQMSSERARRFYFTTERDSYAAKLGQTGNLGVISAVFYRESSYRSRPIPITPPRVEPYEEGKRRGDSSSDKVERPSAGRGQSAPQSAPRDRGTLQNAPSGRGEDLSRLPDDEHAATGIGRSVRNDVRWVNMDLDSRPAAEVTIRYEYYPALVRLGIMPRPYYPPDALRRRESSTGFSPEP